MKKIRIKLGYDILMLVSLALLFGGSAVGMSFHEIAGLALLLAFFVHLLLNRRWIAGAACRIVHRETAGRLCQLFVLDALLLLSFAAVGVSGVLISRILFDLNGGAAWRMVHTFSAALALLLTGIHLGLHARLISAALGAFWEKRGVRIPVALCVLAVCVYGGYSLAVTEFTRWLVMPFVSGTVLTDEVSSATPQRGEEDGVSSATPQSREASRGSADGEDAASGTAREEVTVTPLAGGAGGWNGGRGGDAKRVPDGGGPDGAARARGVLPALKTAVRFISIACVFATVTGGIDYALLRRRQKRDLSKLEGSQ